MRPDILPAGESVLWALANAKGRSGLRYPGEDNVYEKPILTACAFRLNGSFRASIQRGDDRS